MNNTLTLRVGTMPGKLVEVVVEKGTNARKCFELADITVDNREIRLDGNVINLDTEINEGRLLVCMSKIKGNAKTIKVGCMPGKLQVVEIQEGDNAKALFERAGIEVSNHEIRLDGSKIDINDNITGGGLLVAMKKIKGNAEVMCVAKGLTSSEVSTLFDIEEEIPTMLSLNEVEINGNVVIIGNGTTIPYTTVELDMFNSVYILEEVTTTTTETPVLQISASDESKPQEECACEKVDELKEDLEKDLKELRDMISYYKSLARECEAKVEVINNVLDRL